jgi:hypothetical protein
VPHYVCDRCEFFFESVVPQCPKCQQNKTISEVGERGTHDGRSGAPAKRWKLTPGGLVALPLLVLVHRAELPLLFEVAAAGGVFAIAYAGNAAWLRWRPPE